MGDLRDGQLFRAVEIFLLSVQTIQHALGRRLTGPGDDDTSVTRSRDGQTRIYAKHFKPSQAGQRRATRQD